MFKILLLLSAITFGICIENRLEAETELGVLLGKVLHTRKGKTVSAFTGIPYAKPPIGDLRFEAPLPAEPWNGTFDATKSHPMCPQKSNIKEGSSAGSEDCLYLNVYTPQVSNNLLPVMVFIHGGAYVEGSARQEHHGPELLLDKDIVLVTINYRLGALGFLSTGDEVVPGNNGLKDQNLALKWVKKHIIHFGGDPYRITLFGQSVGGCSVNLHLLSPLSKDLIQGAISQSGTALSPRAISPSDQGQRNSKKLAQMLNCPIHSSMEMVECLRKVDVDEFIVQQHKFRPWKIDQLSGFRPVIEPNISGAFLTEHPVDIYKAGKAENVPFMTGLTTEDSPPNIPSLFNTPGLLEEFNENFQTLLPVMLLYEETATNTEEATKKIRSFYLRDQEITNSSKSNVLNMHMDPMILLPEDAVVRLHKAYVRKPVYYYLFGYRGSASHCNKERHPVNQYGVCHTDELFRLFKLGTFPNYKPTEADEKMTDVMLSLWTNFAKTGNPTPDTDSLPKWEQVQSDNLEYYFIKNNHDLKMSNSLHTDRVSFWRTLPINFRTYHITDEI